MLNCNANFYIKIVVIFASLFLLFLRILINDRYDNVVVFKYVCLQKAAHFLLLFVCLSANKRN